MWFDDAAPAALVIPRSSATRKVVALCCGVGARVMPGRTRTRRGDEHQPSRNAHGQREECDTLQSHARILDEDEDDDDDDNDACIAYLLPSSSSSSPDTQYTVHVRWGGVGSGKVRAYTYTYKQQAQHRTRHRVRV